MYLTDGRSAPPTGRDGRRVGLRAAVTANVLALGATSLITDVSAEMVTAILPVYLVTGLGLSMLQFGFLDGVYSGATALLRIVGGYLADRYSARKFMAVVGYLLSAVSKIGFPLVGPSVTGIGSLLAVDRAGKGIRTAPRDAMISASAPAEAQGLAFGLHRAMDTAGAFVGPLAAFAVISAAGSVSGVVYDAVFVISACVGLIGVLALVLLVREPAPARRPARAAVSLRAGAALLRGGAFRAACLAAALLGLASVSDAFVYLSLQARTDLAVSAFPLLPLGTTAVYLLAAVPLGALADRYGRLRVFLIGHLALLGAYLLLGGALPLDGLALIAPTLLLHGLFYAATDGVLMAHAGPLLPDQLRTSGLSVLQTGQAAARALSSVLCGAAWMRWGPETTLRGYALALVLAGALGLWLLRRPTAVQPEEGSR